ncbi:MAG TPA: 1,4-alpha-glucan branching protein domain-containing protein, partial [Dissulfurispiraceae bacterium]
EEGEGGKLPYSRAAAMGRVAEHAAHFVRERETYCSRLSKYVPRPVVLSAFDAELFGHWWHEGIEWLDAVLRRAEGRKSLSVAVVTPSRYLELIAGKKRGNAGSPVHLAPSSWGEGGYNATWIGERNGHLYRHLHRMAERMTVLVQGRIAERERRGENAKARRVVSQAMRELLLAQASDWAFLMEKDRAARYAENRVMGHIENFDVLFSMMKNNHIETAALKEMEKRHNIFGWARRPEDYWPLPFASRSS